MKTQIFNENQIQAMIELLNENKTLAIPTETVFGLAVRANPEAIKNLQQAKNRPEEKVFTIMLKDKSLINDYAYVSNEAQRVINKFMPGALTIVLDKKALVADEIVNGSKTVGIRIPDHTLMISLLEAINEPLIVTSANLSGMGNCFNHEEVLAQLDGRIDGIVKGESGNSIPSTVAMIDANQQVTVFRQGIITKQDIELIMKGE